jgi:rRNA maturation endonuclease Nob1
MGVCKIFRQFLFKKTLDRYQNTGYAVILITFDISMKNVALDMNINVLAEGQNENL